MLKSMNPELLKEIHDPPAERHAAAQVLVLCNVVLYKDCFCFTAVQRVSEMIFAKTKT